MSMSACLHECKRALVRLVTEGRPYLSVYNGDEPCDAVTCFFDSLDDLHNVATAINEFLAEHEACGDEHEDEYVQLSQNEKDALSAGRLPSSLLRGTSAEEETE